MVTSHILCHTRDNGETVRTLVKTTKGLSRALLLAGYILTRVDGVAVRGDDGNEHVITKGPNIHMALTKVITVIPQLTRRVLVADDKEYDFFSHNDFLALCDQLGRYGDVHVQAEELVYLVTRTAFAPTRFRRLLLLSERTRAPVPPVTITAKTAKTLIIPLASGGTKEETFFTREQLERLLLTNGYPVNRIGTLVTYTMPNGEELTDTYISSRTRIPMSLSRIRVCEPFLVK